MKVQVLRVLRTDVGVGCRREVVSVSAEEEIGFERGIDLR
jgi:hypothetical protein